MKFITKTRVNFSRDIGTLQNLVEKFLNEIYPIETQGLIADPFGKIKIQWAFQDDYWHCFVVYQVPAQDE